MTIYLSIYTSNYMPAKTDPFSKGPCLILILIIPSSFRAIIVSYIAQAWLCRVRSPLCFDS